MRSAFQKAKLLLMLLIISEQFWQLFADVSISALNLHTEIENRNVRGVDLSIFCLNAFVTKMGTYMRIETEPKP